MLSISEFLRKIARLIETIAAICLAVVTILVFASAIGRYLFSFPIPDSFDFSRLLLGLSIAWGYAVLGFRGGHICVDLLAEALPHGARRLVELFSQTVLLIFTSALAWKLFDRIADAYDSGESTFDLRLPTWPLIGGIWLGLAAAVITTFAGLILLLSGAELDQPDIEEEAYE